MERIQHKIGKIKEYLSLISGMKDNCYKQFISDPIYRGALLHYLYLMADTCIVLGEQVIKYKGLRLPQSYSEVFDILGEAKILNPLFAHEFAKIAGFRNFLDHDYELADAKIMCDQIIKKCDDVEKYIKQMEKAL